MIRNPINGRLVLDAGNHPDSTPATATNLYVNIEDALEPLRPGHSGMTLCWCPWLCICNLLQVLATPSWSDPPAPSVVGGQDAVVAGEIDPGFWPDRARANAANRAMKSTGSKATWVVPSR